MLLLHLKNVPSSSLGCAQENRGTTEPFTRYEPYQKVARRPIARASRRTRARLPPCGASAGHCLRSPPFGGPASYSSSSRLKRVGHNQGISLSVSHSKVGKKMISRISRLCHTLKKQPPKRMTSEINRIEFSWDSKSDRAFFSVSVG